MAGQIVYAVMTYKHTVDPTQVVLTIETPQQIEKCVLHVLWIYTEDIKPKKQN